MKQLISIFAISWWIEVGFEPMPFRTHCHGDEFFLVSTTKAIIDLLLSLRQLNFVDNFNFNLVLNFNFVPSFANGRSNIDIPISLSFL